MAKGKHQKRKQAQVQRTQEQIQKEYEEAVVKTNQARQQFIDQKKAQALALIRKIHKPHKDDEDLVLQAWWSKESSGLIRESERRYPMPTPINKERKVPNEQPDSSGWT